MREQKKQAEWLPKPLVLLTNIETMEVKEFSGPSELISYLIDNFIIPEDVNRYRLGREISQCAKRKGVIKKYGQNIYFLRKSDYTTEEMYNLINKRNKSPRREPVVLIFKDTLEDVEFKDIDALYLYAKENCLIRSDSYRKFVNNELYHVRSCTNNRRKFLVFRKSCYNRESAIAVINAKQSTYGTKLLFKEGQGKLTKAIVLEIIKEDRMSITDEQIGNKYGLTRVNINHLFLGKTYSSLTGIKWVPKYKTDNNTAISRRKSRPNQKMDALKASEIRALRASGYKIRELSEMYKVSSFVIHNVIHNKIYAK